jgi:hypothetical protein
MKAINELQQIKGDAYEYYNSSMQQDNLFEKIFLVDEIMDEIKSPDKYFVIGEKGSGKTAYAVYLSRHPSTDLKSKIKMVENTVYDKFVTMKQNKSLDMSTYKDIWINMIYLVLCEEIRELIQNSPWKYKHYISLTQAIQTFYNKAFKPEFINALEFVDKSNISVNTMIEQGVFTAGGNVEEEFTQKYVEQSYQLSLMKLKDGFEKALQPLRMRNKFILFIDGIDARPTHISNKEYLDCLKGLVNAVITLNSSFLKGLGIKITLLIRPDILYSMSIHNMNQKIRDNSVLLRWVTTYKKYRESKLFTIADNYLSKQQDESYECGICWDTYFPYKIKNKYNKRLGRQFIDDSFVGILRYSLYKPRDILTMLNEFVSVGSGDSFKYSDFNNIIANYSEYLKGELKDYMLIYMSEDDYSNFYNFFDLFDNVQFTYDEFVKIHMKFLNSLKELKRSIPYKMETPAEALQLLYDTNIICSEERITKRGRTKNNMLWSYKERNYANIQPEVKRKGKYRFHSAYARAFKIL